MPTRFFLATALTLAACQLPAQAAPETWRQSEPAAPAPHKNPWLASGLTIAAPLALGLTGLALSQSDPNWRLDGRWSALDATLVVAPLGLAAGYAYAGEPADGLLVGLISSAAMATGVYFSRGGTLSGAIDPQAASVWPLLASTAVVLVAGAFAVSDVHELASPKKGPDTHAPTR